MNDISKSVAYCVRRQCALWLVACAGIVFACQARAAENSEYDQLKDQVQSFIVDQLSSATGNVGVIIIQDRSDEWLREDHPLESDQWATLGLYPVRLVKVLKGSFNVKPGEIVYLYDPNLVRTITYSRSGSRERPILYYPLFLGDDVPRIVFVRQEQRPNSAYLRKGHVERDPSLRQFVEDAGTMKGDAHFIEKYGLTEVFSNRVFSIIDSCVFAVDCPVPSLSPVSAGLNQENLDRTTKHLPKLRAHNGLIQLTRREISEIVFALSMTGGPDAGTRYAKEVQEGGGILEPMSKAALRTKVGMKLDARIQAVGQGVPSSTLPTLRDEQMK